MPKRSKSSAWWLNRQRRDSFARAARREGRVSRAHYKLAQMDARFGLLRAGHWVLELGAAPGGWTAYLAERVVQGRVIAVDPLPVSVGGQRVEVIEGRFGDAAVGRRLGAILAESKRPRPLDLVLSDMVPNISGVRVVDQAGAMALLELATDAVDQWLASGGGMAVKLMQGDGVRPWLKAVKCRFAQVSVVKPAASRSGSREAYVVACGFRPPI